MPLLALVLLLPLASACHSGGVQAPSSSVGAPAPALVLRDAGGAEHRLADLRGRVVVLEWTSPVCPAVAALADSGRLADTRAALDPERTAWLQVDSSWFSPSLPRAVEAWRERQAPGVPYLLDAGGAAGRALGATATPQLFVVDAAGTLVYAGALDSGADEAARRNHVLEAVAAALAGEPAPVATTRALGCSVKYGAPRDPRPGELAEDEDARERYLAARERARAGEHEAALDALERALEAGLGSPQAPVADPAFRGLLDDPDARARVRPLLRARPARGAVRLTAPDEPGAPLVVAGRVLDERGAPVPGALVGAYHTGDDGYYAEGSTDADNPRLFGYVSTGRDGRYRLRTVLPRGYGGSREAGHVHLVVSRAGFETLRGVRGTIYFEDGLTASDRREIEREGGAIRRRTTNAEGVALCVHDVVLSR